MRKYQEFQNGHLNFILRLPWKSVRIWWGHSDKHGNILRDIMDLTCKINDEWFPRASYSTKVYLFERYWLVTWHAEQQVVRRCVIPKWLHMHVPEKAKQLQGHTNIWEKKWDATASHVNMAITTCNQKCRPFDNKEFERWHQQLQTNSPHILWSLRAWRVKQHKHSTVCQW